MKTLSGRQEPETASSLDNGNTSPRKRYRRMYHRVLSGLERSGQVRLITLTTHRVEDNQHFQRHFTMLRMRLLRRGLMLDYIRCPEYTKSGLRHEHILFRGSYIEQAYLSALWEAIHGARIVDIRRVGSKTGLARYLASYLAKAVAGRCSYSWGWVWRGLAKSWVLTKRVLFSYGFAIDEVLTYWRECVRLNLKPDERGLYLEWRRRCIRQGVVNAV